MAEEINRHLDRIKTQLQSATLTPQGIRDFVEEARIAIHSIDSIIEQYQRERQEIYEVVVPLLAVYSSLTEGDQLIDKRDLMTSDMDDVNEMEACRDRVLELALDPTRVDIRNRQGHVEDTLIEQALLSERNSKPLPWANPRAVVGTVLMRSGKFEKVFRGEYRPIKRRR